MELAVLNAVGSNQFLEEKIWTNRKLQRKSMVVSVIEEVQARLVVIMILCVILYIFYFFKYFLIPWCEKLNDVLSYYVIINEVKLRKRAVSELTTRRSQRERTSPTGNRLGGATVGITANR